MFCEEKRMEENNTPFNIRKYWYLLRSASLKELRIKQFLQERRDAGDDVEVYIPEFTRTEERATTRVVSKQVLSHDRSQVFIQKQTYDGPKRTVTVNRPFLQGYVLVHATFDYLKSLSIFNDWCYALVRATKTELPINVCRYVTVPDSQVKQFKRMIELYRQEGATSLSLHSGLVEGDTVRIVAGPFAGFEGTLQTSQGKEGGRVVVKLTHGMFYDTLTIPMDNLEVLSFSKHSYHVYKKFNAYNERILRCMENIYAHGAPTEEDLAQCIAFIRRYSNLQLDTENGRARHMGYMLLTHVALNMTDEVKSSVEACRKQLTVVRTDLSRAFLNICLFIAVNDAQSLKAAEEIAAKWDPAQEAKFKDKKYRDIINTIDRFKAIVR